MIVRLITAGWHRFWLITAGCTSVGHEPHSEYAGIPYKKHATKVAVNGPLFIFLPPLNRFSTVTKTLLVELLSCSNARMLELASDTAEPPYLVPRCNAGGVRRSEPPLPTRYPTSTNEIRLSRQEIEIEDRKIFASFFKIERASHWIVAPAVTTYV